MNPKHLLKISFVLLITIIAVLNIRISLAADQIVNVDFPCPAGNCAPPTDLPSYINTIYQFALGISGLLALGMIVAGGVYYTVSAGNSSRQGDAKSMITSAIWGLVLLFGSYLILNTINPQITKMGLNFSKAAPPTSSNSTEPLVSSTECPDFSTLKINPPMTKTVESPTCLFRKNRLIADTEIVEENSYYDTGSWLKFLSGKTLKAGTTIWTYPYFFKENGPSKAVCLIFAFRPSGDEETETLTINENLTICKPQEQKSVKSGATESW